MTLEEFVQNRIERQHRGAFRPDEVAELVSEAWRLGGDEQRKMIRDYTSHSTTDGPIVDKMRGSLADLESLSQSARTVDARCIRLGFEAAESELLHTERLITTRSMKDEPWTIDHATAIKGLRVMIRKLRESVPA